MKEGVHGLKGRQFANPIFKNHPCFAQGRPQPAAHVEPKPSPLAPLLPPVPEDLGIVGGALAKRKISDCGPVLKPLKKEKRNNICFTL